MSCFSTSQGGRASFPKGKLARVRCSRHATASAWHSPCRTLKPAEVSTMSTRDERDERGR